MLYHIQMRKDAVYTLPSFDQSVPTYSSRRRLMRTSTEIRAETDYWMYSNVYPSVPVSTHRLYVCVVSGRIMEPWYHQTRIIGVPVNRQLHSPSLVCGGQKQEAGWRKKKHALVTGDCVCRIVSGVGRDDVIKWKHFPRYWPFVRGIHRSPVESPHKGQWLGA